MYCKNFVIPGIQKIYTAKKSRQKFKCEYLVFYDKRKTKTKWNSVITSVHTPCKFQQNLLNELNTVQPN